MATNVKQPPNDVRPERKAVAALARAMWRADPERLDYPDHESRVAAFEETKKERLRISTRVLRELSKEGYFLENSDEE